MRLTSFGKKFTGTTGIGELMEDLGKALAAGDKLMLGGGNPAHIPGVEKVLRQRMETMLADGTFEKMVGDYDEPAGDGEFRSALSELFNKTYGWNITAENIALTNGSQTTFFYLFNLFADGKRKILLPIAPEYIGYADAGIVEDIFISVQPQIRETAPHRFKYYVDLDQLPKGDAIGAICISRPTNPSGNVVTDEEIRRLHAHALAMDVPLIIDNAYGLPFPHIIFNEVSPFYAGNVILCMSLSKIGLPGVRTGIVVADRQIIRAVASLNAIIGLAPTSVGANLAMDMVRSGEIIRLARETVQPYYRSRMEQAVAWITESFGSDIEYRIHEPEGALFLWLWFPGLSISSYELYQRLKKRGVLVISGHYFFPGLKAPWQHQNECIRVSYAQKEEVVREGIAQIAEEVHALQKKEA